MSLIRTAAPLSALALLLGLFFAPLRAAAADADPKIAVAHFTTNSKSKARQKQVKQVRGAIVTALANTGEVQFVSWSQVVAAGKRAKIAGNALQTPASVGPLVGAQGGDVVVLGRMVGTRLTLRIIDATGKQIWNKQVTLSQGKLSSALAKRFAAAILAAARVSMQDAAPPPPPPPEPEPQFIDTPARADAYDDEDAEAPRPVPVAEEQADSEQDEAWSNVPAQKLASKHLGPKMIDFGFDLAFTWRSYRFCNGVDDCDATPPESAGPSIDFTTGTPYLGFNARLDFYPFAHFDNRFVQGLGLGGGLHYNPKIKASYALNDVTTELSGHQLDFWVDAIYRLYFDLAALKNSWAGLRLGYASYRFSIDENPFFTSSLRGGFSAELEIGLPVSRFLTVELSGTILPWASPDDEARALFGGDLGAEYVAADGGGFALRAGLTSDFGRPDGHLGAGIYFDYARFGDRFSKYADAEGSAEIPARAIESYCGLSLGLKARY